MEPVKKTKQKPQCLCDDKSVYYEMAKRLKNRYFKIIC